MSEYWERYLGAGLPAIDPDVAELIRREEERQAGRIILIPSESIAPAPVRAALGSVFNSIYAEGYPALRMTRDDEALLLDVEHQLAYYRRYGDRRFYKGAELVDIVESLAMRRCADCFANERVSSQNLFANVQPLSGAAANLAVYDAIMKPGDTLMGMDLYQGGHLTHGSPFNLSGRRYKVASYGVGRDGKLDYEAIEQRALEARPKVIVAGFTSFPWAPDWRRFREIADACGAYLMADVAHPAGLIVAGAYPSPVGYADVITFTTHKTICGPRGAVILTDKEWLGAKINAAVFPGAQGGPHPNKFAAMAVAFSVAQSDEFKRMMRRVTENAQALAWSLVSRGLTLAYGGTDTHLLLVDLRGIKTPNGEPLRGEAAVRIMELAGLVANKNTIPGDTVTALGSGVRLGTPWVTQRGMGALEMDRIAHAIHRLLTAIRPFHYQGLKGELPRGKIALDVLESVKRDVLELARGGAVDVALIPRPPLPLPQDRGCRGAVSAPVPPSPIGMEGGRGVRASPTLPLVVSGRRARSFLRETCTADMSSLAPGEWKRTLLLDMDGKVIADLHALALEADFRGRERFLLVGPDDVRERGAAWLRGLSDGYVLFDREDIYRKVEGPVVVQQLEEATCDESILRTLEAFGAQERTIGEPVAVGAEAGALYQGGQSDLFCLTKPYFVGQAALAGVRSGLGLAGQLSRPPLGKAHAPAAAAKPEFAWQAPAAPAPQRTPLYNEHRKLTRQLIPFAGWEMPVWYTSVSEEHRAVRQAAGLFDVAHMGVFEVSGPHATAFLDTMASNYAGWLQPGQSQYSFLLDPDGNVIDDIFVYYVERGRYIVVVNAANAEKDWAWLNAANDGSVLIDRGNSAMEVPGKATLRDLKDPAWGADRRVDIALQGPASLPTLQALTEDARLKDTLARIRRTELASVTLAGLDLIVARTGYTGESIGFEIFAHPDEAARLWRLILEAGAPLGVKPCGLAARDSTRIEAGLPLYGHELNGPLGMLPQEAGFSSYLKAHKPFYVGREAIMVRAAKSTRQLVRFQLNETGARALRGGEHGEPIVNRRGAYVGRVTSATLVGGLQVGLALVERRYAEPGTPLGIYPASAGKPPPIKPQADLAEGDTVTLPVWATVLSRFPARKAAGAADASED